MGSPSQFETPFSRIYGGMCGNLGNLNCRLDLMICLSFIHVSLALNFATSHS